MRVLYFAQARLATGQPEEHWETTSSLSPEDFWAKLLRQHPGLAQLRSSCRLARNGRFLNPGETIQPDDEMAVLPPVSGG